MLDSNKIKNILLEGGYVAKEDLEKSQEESKNKKYSLLNVLLKKELITRDLFGQAMAEHFGVDYADLNSYQPSRQQILKIPEQTARNNHLVLFKENDEWVTLATDNPLEAATNSGIFQKVFPGKKIKLAYSLTEDIEAVFVFYRKTLDTRFNKIIKTKGEFAPGIINEILKDALSFKASDIHFEPREEVAVVRFRIDGVLQEAGKLPKSYYENILNRIKIQANLRIDEHFSAQDGAMRFRKKDEKIDMRVSIVPTIEGEKITIRLLAQYVGSLNLSNLGLQKNDEDLIYKISQKPFGMILVVGPTGSGKTTTLYSLLKNLNNPGVNITSIEDPVEYKINEINQIQVNKTTNLDFAKGLRSIVRQDPDIILVGEIRDRETAEIAVNASLTGHLLLSTFHSNNASTAIPRLLDMDIEPFLLASTLEVVMAQRLARRLCESCRYSYQEDVSNLKKILPQAEKYFSGSSITLYKSKGCAACGGLGYKGRIGVFEIIKISQEIKDLILKNPSAGEVWNLAKKQGSVSLFSDGIAKAKSGITSLDEILRVVFPE